MNIHFTQTMFRVALYAICFLFTFSLSAEQTYLLLRTDNQSGLLSTGDKAFTPVLKKTDYLQASENGKIVYRPAVKSPWQFAELNLKNGQPELLPIGAPAEITNQDLFPTFSPDGSKLLWVRYGEVKSILHVWDCTDKKVLLAEEIAGYIFLPSWSPDTMKLAFYLKEKSPVLTKDDYGFGVFDLAKKELKQYPVSLPTRSSPQRDSRPSWSNNSKYVFYEGRYENAKDKFQVVIDTVSGKHFSRDEGLWINDADLVYLFPADGKSFDVFLNPLTDVLNGKINLTNSMGKMSISGFQASVVDRKTSTLYFQPDDWALYSFRLKENKEEKISKFDFKIRNLNIIRK